MDGFGGFAQGLTNAINAIANLVIRASGMSVKNLGWPYFDGKFSNGKTSLVHYRTLSFFAFLFLKKTKVQFFSSFQMQKLYRTCSLRFNIGTVL
jgi:hypothetical protein